MKQYYVMCLEISVALEFKYSITEHEDEARLSHRSARMMETKYDIIIIILCVCGSFASCSVTMTDSG